MKNSSYRYCGRDFSQEELENIRRIIAQDSNRIALKPPVLSVKRLPGANLMAA